MKIKKAVVMLLSLCLIISQISMAKAAEAYPNLDENIIVKSYSGGNMKQGKGLMQKIAMHFHRQKEIWIRPL